MGASTTTSTDGAFHLGGLPSGITTFTVSRVGYKALRFETTVLPETTLVVSIRMRAVLALDAIDITESSVSPRLARTGFFERQHRGIGAFVSPEKVDSLSHVSTPAQLLRGIRGIEIKCRPVGCIVHTRRAPDCLALFVNGSFYRDQLDFVLSTAEVYAIEVYDRPSIVPTQFQARLPPKAGGGLTVAAGCGALVVWTRTYAGH